MTTYKRSGWEAGPGIHAFIVGISAYPYLPIDGAPLQDHHFGMRKLSSTALSAYYMYSWLRESDRQDTLPLPLATCRVLLLPSAGEIAKVEELKDFVDSPSRDNFVERAGAWRNDAATYKNNITLFYFAGHGVQRTSNDSVLLLEGAARFPEAPLAESVAVRNIFQGMATNSSKYPDMAQTQFYFIDACQNLPAAFKELATIQVADTLTSPLDGVDERCAPIYFAALPGAKAYARKDQQTVFSELLLECLRGDAGDLAEISGVERWHVSVDSLNRALKDKVAEWNAANARRTEDQQDFGVSGWVRNGILNFLKGPPKVTVQLTIYPQDALGLVAVSVLDEARQPGPTVPTPLQPHPYRDRWTAGVYTISATIEPPDPRFPGLPGKTRPVLPPIRQWTVRVVP